MAGRPALAAVFVAAALLVGGTAAVKAARPHPATGSEREDIVRAARASADAYFGSFVVATRPARPSPAIAD